MKLFEWFEERGFVDQITHEELKEKLKAPLSFYVGFDPTAPSLHLGSFVALVALKKLQEAGCRPVVLLGGATGLIGDPSGKDMERPLLSHDEIYRNVQSIMRQLEGILDFSNAKVKPIIVNNFDWYSRMNVIEFLRDVGKSFRISTMLGKESVKSRLESEEGMSFTEFTYQVLQGYDFYHLYKHYNVILQIGGSDQYGNITSGIEFTRRIERTTLYGMSLPLLVRSDGKKFGKSEKGAIWLDRSLTSPFDLYQYLVRVPDADIVKMLCLLTLVDYNEIKTLEKEMLNGQLEPNFLQKRLASEVIRLIHQESGLKEALDATRALSPGKGDFNIESIEEIVDSTPNIIIQREELVQKSVVDALVRSELISSKSEARRMIKNGGVYLNGEKVTDPNSTIGEDLLLKGNMIVLSVGKKNMRIVRIIE